MIMLSALSLVSDGRVIRESLLILLATLLGSLASSTRAAPVDRLQDQLLGSRLTVHVPEPMTEMVGIKPVAADNRACTTTIIFTDDRTKWVVCGTCVSDESWPLANHFALNIDFD